MAITTGDGYVASSKQIITYTKTAATTTTANSRSTIRGAAGNPGAATMAYTAFASNGQVPTDATSGMPVINAFGGGATGYLTRVQWNNSVVGRVELWDVLWGGNIPTGAGGFGSLQTLNATPASYLSRCPDGAGHGLRIFFEITTTMSATATTLSVTYTNSDGTGSRSTGASASLSGLIANRWVEFPLQAGDRGVQKIDAVVIGGATNAAGVGNIIVARPLWTNGTRVANSGTSEGLDMTGMPIVYADSALVVTTVADSTSSGIVDMNIEIANG